MCGFSNDGKQSSERGTVTTQEESRVVGAVGTQRTHTDTHTRVLPVVFTIIARDGSSESKESQEDGAMRTKEDDESE